MSGSSAGKFQDHYIVLGLDPQADQEAIERAYELFSEKYGSDNIDDADPEKLAMVQLAYEVLTDPVLRKEFDKLKGVEKQGPPQFDAQAFFEGRGRDTGLRMAVLSILYDRRRNNPYRPSLSNRHTEGMLQATNEDLTFALWYLKQRGWVASDDKSNLVITIDGMDYLEQNWPEAETVLPFIKGSALAESLPKVAPAEAQTETSANGHGRKGARIVGLLRSRITGEPS